MQRLRYYLWYGLRSWHRMLAAPLLRWAYLKLKAETWFEGIMILDASIRGVDRAKFNADTVAALTLIKSVDPRRFRRLQREIKIIVNTESLSARGSYSRPDRCCNIDYTRFELGDDSEWNTWRHASTLVHEATHGAIDSRCVGYIPRLRSRIERLCHIEQRRFVSKADTPDRCWSDTLIAPFDEACWHDSWHRSWPEKVKRGASVIREALRDAKK